VGQELNGTRSTD